MTDALDIGDLIRVFPRRTRATPIDNPDLQLRNLPWSTPKGASYG